MNPIKNLPEMNWTAQARREIAITGEQLLAMSDYCWRLGDCGVVGLIYTSLTSPPWMWMALTEDVRFRDLIDFRRMREMIPYGTLVAVDEDFTVGRRFAEFYGFEATPTLRKHKGVTYRTYRRV
jgi:hypothetical protein